MSNYYVHLQNITKVKETVMQLKLKKDYEEKYEES